MVNYERYHHAMKVLFYSECVLRASTLQQNG
jgi:hypothetical protein